MDTKNGASVAPSYDWKNFGYFFRDVTKLYSERIAFRYRTRGEREFEEWSYARVEREGRALIALLAARGLGRGDRVAIWSENRPEWGVAYFALVAAGYVVVPVDILLPDEEAARVVAAAETAALIAPARNADRLAAALPPDTRLRVVIGIDGAPSPSAGESALSWAEGLAASGGASDPMPDPSGIEPETLASLIFTSGTTGRPKAVMLSHAGIIANVAASIHALPVDCGDVFLLVLPLHHTYPTTCSLLSPLAAGASITICEKVVGKVIVDDARDSGATFLIGVPLLFDKLALALAQGIAAKGRAVGTAVGALRAISRAGSALGLRALGRALFAGIRRKAGLGNVRLMVSGGGPLSASTARAFDELGFALMQGYGMSENGPLISVNPPSRPDNRSVGPAVERTEVRIAADGAEPGARRGSDGEIQVRSPSLMLGYWRDPESSAEAFTTDGWLRTGDLGRIDKRGYIYITGRSKSLIVTTGGKNVQPEEIETLFEGSSVVREILIVGKKAEGGGGEEVAALIVPDLERIAEERGSGWAPGDVELRELVKVEVARINRALPPYKKIADFRLRRAEFEKTSSRKIKRFLYADWERIPSDPA